MVRQRQRIHQVAPEARSATPEVIREGTILMFDSGCTVAASDLSGIFVLGKPRRA